MKHLVTICLATILFLSSCFLSTEPDNVTQKILSEWRTEHFGMFIHFGIYSELGGIWKGKKIPYYGEQIMNHARIPVLDYEEVAKHFNSVDFNADKIVSLAQKTGMKYIVITTKHHDGFCMFKTKTTTYNIVDFTPFGRDVVKEFADACQNKV